MKAREILNRLQAEGIENKNLVKNQWPEWVGKVTYIEGNYNRQTEDELENADHVYKLEDHGIYLKICGIVDENGVDEDGNPPIEYERSDYDSRIWDWYMIRQTYPIVETRYY